MDLANLGWDSFFEDNFEQYKAQNLIPARVFLKQKDQYLVCSEHGEKVAKITGKIHHQSGSGSDFPAVGDWVVVDTGKEKEFVTIHTVLPRKSSFVRKVAGGRKRKSGGITEEQIIAANIDTVFIVIGLDRDFNLRRIERYLTLVYNSGANPVIVLNKSDICSDLKEKIVQTESIASGIPIFDLSAEDDVGLDKLLPYITTGQTASLVGSSGVGKSTIINCLLAENRQEVRSLSESVGKGQHTTSNRELIFMPSGGILMDNPGMREVQLWAEDEDLKETFQDIKNLAGSCRFKDCLHDKEPGCGVKAAIADGSLDQDRYQSYQKLKQELWYLEERKHKTSRQLEKGKWEKILKSHNISLKEMTRISKRSKKS